MVKISEKHDGLPNFQLKLTERNTVHLKELTWIQNIFSQVFQPTCPGDSSTGICCNNFDSTKSFFGDNNFFLINLLVVSDV